MAVPQLQDDESTSSTPRPAPIFAPRETPEQERTRKINECEDPKKLLRLIIKPIVKEMEEALETLERRVRRIERRVEDNKPRNI